MDRTMKVLATILFLAALAATSQGRFFQDMFSEGSLIEEVVNEIHPLRPKSGSLGKNLDAVTVNCESWRLAVEAHNAQDWTQVPKQCRDYVGHYMLGDQYRADSKYVCIQAWYHAKGYQIQYGTDVWIFDIDETTLSNLPYYASHGFGAEKYNSTLFNQWVEKGAAPALPETLYLYNKLVNYGIKPIFITGRPESQRSVTELNLKNAGFHTFEKLVLKSSDYSGQTAVNYKAAERKKIENAGYRIIGNIGDQWSDLLGKHAGKRTFKLPDPMYYIA